MGARNKRTATSSRRQRPAALRADELAATVRFVAREAPHLALSLVWSIVTNPDAVLELREAGHMVEPEHLIELARLDPALQAVVQSSDPAVQAVRAYRLKTGGAEGSS